MNLPTLFSIIIPARNEEDCIEMTVRGIVSVLRARSVPHEVVTVDDGSSDNTWGLLNQLKTEIPELKPVRNMGPNGYGRAIQCGFDAINGDAVVVTMADASEDPEDIARFWEVLQEGYDCAFGSRWMKGSSVSDYPRVKLFMNRAVNTLIQILFLTRYNDTTNGFKAYRKEVIEGCKPFLSPHFNLAVEIPLKAMIRGYSYKVVPNSWKNRTVGEAKLKLWEMGRRYAFIILYCLLEKLLSCGDYKKKNRG